MLTRLIVGHLFGLYNLNQLSHALEIPKSGLYHHLSQWSLSQWKRLLLEIGCHPAYNRIEKIESMSLATQSRHRMTLAVDDTVQQRDGKLLSYCYHWYSGRFHKTLNGQNILAVTVTLAWRLCHSPGGAAGWQTGTRQYPKTEDSGWNDG